MVRANQKLWLLLLILFFFLAGCAGGIRLFETKVRIRDLKPAREATNVPINTKICFYVSPVDAWVDLDVWYFDARGRRRDLYPEPKKVRDPYTNETSYRYSFYQELQPYTIYNLEILAIAYDNYGHRLKDAFIDTWFETGSWVDPKQVKEMDEEIESE